jgi:hypothetical protein
MQKGLNVTVSMIFVLQYQCSSCCLEEGFMEDMDYFAANASNVPLLCNCLTLFDEICERFLKFAHAVISQYKPYPFRNITG